MLQLATLFLVFLTCLADPTPARIYNVLITSKKNLSPSHAQPVYEPVLRTTSIGYAFPPFYYTSLVQNIPASYINQDYSGFQKVETIGASQSEPKSGSVLQQQSEIGSNQPTKANTVHQQNDQLEALHEQLIPQYRPTALNYAQYLPKEENTKKEDQNPMFPPLQQSQEEIDPKKLIANLRRNNGIPDVPPPPLPVRNLMKQ